jgi:hypothetical protein
MQKITPKNSRQKTFNNMQLGTTPKYENIFSAPNLSLAGSKIPL